ncbi:uncharacterized protein LOC119692261 [Plutella xylostella]|uniref:uncharacterized protein LOC119692261 n=1 Tax=Plutella xylostella TaxID=51655 RepID=UPI002032533B|nr:uncharacterized protein LOC119692261 [Plutella xylostella]
MSVPSLQALSLQKVVTRLWWTSDLRDALLDIAVDIKWYGTGTFLLTEESKTIRNTYQEIIKAILTKVTAATNIPLRIKLKIALSLMRIENDTLKSIVDLTKFLCEPSKENIAYCIDKVWFTTDCTVDRCETVLSILQYSYMNLEINAYNISKFCLITPDKLFDMMRYMRTICCDRKEISMKICKLLKAILNFDMYDRMETDARCSKFFKCDPDMYQYDEILVLAHILLNESTEIFRHFYNNWNTTKKVQKLASATVCVVLSCENSFSIQESLIYAYKILPDKLFLKILLRFHKLVFDKLFLSFFSSTCLDFFNLLLKNNQFKICRDILHNTEEILCKQVPETSYKSIVYDNSKCTFMNMWSQAPDSVKLLLREGLNDMMDCALKNNDVQLLSIFLNDSAFSNEEKQQHYIHLFSRLVLPSNQSKVNEITEEVAGFDINEIINNITVADFKKILIKICETQCNLEYLVKNIDEEVLINFKIEVTKDKQFMIDLIIAVLITSDAEKNMKYLFMWLFNNEADAQHYVQKYLVSDFWLADLYKTYLLTTSNKSVYPNTDIFKYLNVPDDIKNLVKEITRNDLKLVFKLCEKYTARKFCKIYKLLSCLYNENQGKEKAQLKLQFLHSKCGEKSIYRLFSSNYFNENWYVTYQFMDTIKYYFKFHKYWLDCEFRNEEFECFIKNLPQKLPHPNSVGELKHLKTRHHTGRIPLFYSESPRDNRVIVDANYRIFCNIILLDAVAKYRVSMYMNHGLQGTLTEYSVKFPSEWYTFKEIPVVLE